MKGRPYGVTGKYRDKRNKPISVYEWRKINPLWKEYQKKNRLKHKENNLRRIIFKTYNISLEDYKSLTNKCFLCGFDKFPCDLHHKDLNKKNNDINNFIGLCPNCHHGLHRKHIINPFLV